MQLRLEQLDGDLERQLRPVYLLYGDEPLLVQEAADAIRGRARAAGHTEREVMHADSGFDWNALLAASDSLSLFAERRILEVRLPTGKPGEAGARALRAYAERPAGDTVLMVISAKPEPAARRSAWVKALDRAGAVVPVWPVDARRLPAWIGARMERAGLAPTREAVGLLAERVEGNLLACAQEIDKLRLLHGPGPLDARAVAAAVADSARYDVFTLADAVIAGQAARAQRVLTGLRAEGVEPVLVVWALAREARQLAALAAEVGAGHSVGQVLAAHRIWESRKKLLGQALARHDARFWQARLAECARADRVVKGQAPGNPWDELVQLSLHMAGRSPLSAA